MVRWGYHASPRGHTQRSIDTFAACPPAAINWLGGLHQPHDGAAYPDAWHFVRLPTPAVGTDANAYAQAMGAIITPWRAIEADVAALLFIPGNEPEFADGFDVTVAWDIAAWLLAAPEYADALRAMYPGIRMAAPALMTQHTDRLRVEYLSLFEFTTCHCYWQIQDAPGIRWHLGGGSYTHALALGKPVVVTEVGVVSESGAYADGNMDWSTRNQQLATWIGEADDAGVLAACAFVVDAPADFACFDIGPEAAAMIRARIRPTSSPVLRRLPVGYARDSDPRGYRPLDARWQPFVAARNAAEAAAICDAYDAACQEIGYDANAAIAQGAVETAIFTSNRWQNSHNAAGIGIYSDGTPDIIWGDLPNGDIETGIRAQVELLSDYYGDGVEPWGILEAQGFGGMHKGFSRLDQMDGVWASDAGYSAAIVEYLMDVLDGAAPPPVPTQFEFVDPVDAPIVQGSLGPYSHAGSKQDLGIADTGFYALDYGCAFGTPIHCTADGTVIYNDFNHPLEGQTGHTICVQHAGGYESRYCHLSEWDLPVGSAVTQGQIIAHSGAPDRLAADGPIVANINGFGSGAHLHFSISEGGHWIKCEGLMADGEMGPYDGYVTQKEEDEMKIGDGFAPDELRLMWFGTHKPTKAQLGATPYQPDQLGTHGAYGQLANGQFKTDEQDFTGTSICLGRCLDKETPDPGTPGRSVIHFERGKLTALKQPNDTYLIRVN